MHRRSTTQPPPHSEGANLILPGPSVDFPHRPAPAKPLPPSTWDALSAVANAAPDEGRYPRALKETLAEIVSAVGAQAGAVFLADSESSPLLLAAYY